MSVPATIAIAVGTFTAIKLAFGFLGWYSKSSANVEGGSDQGQILDNLYRERLYELWAHLQLGTFFDVAQGGLRHLETRVRETFKTRERAFWMLGGGFLVVNLLSCCLGYDVFVSLLSRATVGHPGAGLIKLAHQEGWAEITTLTVGTALLGIVLDILSAFISWYFLKRAVRSGRLRIMLRHGAYDVGIAVFAMAWSFMTFTVVAGLAFGSALGPTRTIYLERAIGQPLPWLALFSILAASASLPTVAHALTVIGALLAYLTPDRLRELTMRCISLVVKDDKPVLSQLGTVVGAIAALLAAVGSVLAKL